MDVVDLEDATGRLPVWLKDVITSYSIHYTKLYDKGIIETERLAASELRDREPIVEFIPARSDDRSNDRIRTIQLKQRPPRDVVAVIRSPRGQQAELGAAEAAEALTSHIEVGHAYGIEILVVIVLGAEVGRAFDKEGPVFVHRWQSMAVHCAAMVAMQKKGAIVFDYGNNLRQRAFDA